MFKTFHTFLDQVEVTGTDIQSYDDTVTDKQNTASEGHSESPRESETTSVGDSQEFDDIDPKIRKGLEKIKKLDAILSDKVKVWVWLGRN